MHSEQSLAFIYHKLHKPKFSEVRAGSWVDAKPKPIKLKAYPVVRKSKDNKTKTSDKVKSYMYKVLTKVLGLGTTALIKVLKAASQLITKPSPLPSRESENLSPIEPRLFRTGGGEGGGGGGESCGTGSSGGTLRADAPGTPAASSSKAAMRRVAAPSAACWAPSSAAS